MNAQPLASLMLAAVASGSDTNSTSRFHWPPTRDEVISAATQYGPKLLGALAIFVVGLIIARWIGNLTLRGLNKRDMEPPVRMLLVRLVKLLIVFLTLLMIADNFQIKLFPLLAGLGVAGVGVGLAMQGVLSNLVAGLTIIFVKTFRVGDYVEIAGAHGQVDTIELFSTTLIHADLSRVIVPNRKIVGEILHNYGKIRQADLSVGVAYNTDLSRALHIVRDIMDRNPRVLKDPVAGLGTSALGESAIFIAIKPWVKLADFGPAQAEINKELIEKFREAGIQIPFPQREIRVLSDAGANRAA